MILSFLFDPSRYQKRKEGDQLQFERKYGTILIEVKSVIDQSFEETNAVLATIPPHCRDKNLHANLMSGFMTGHVSERFAEFTYIDSNGRTVLSMDKRYALYFKKLDTNKRPNNVKTNHSEMLYQQMAMPGQDKMPIVFVGYTVDDTKSAITGYYASCVKGANVLWTTDISTISGSSRKPAEAGPIDSTPPQGRVRVITRDKKVGD